MGKRITGDDDDGEAYHVLGGPVGGDEDDLDALGFLVEVLDGRTLIKLDGVAPLMTDPPLSCFKKHRLTKKK